MIIILFSLSWIFLASFRVGMMFQMNRFYNGDFSKINEYGITDGDGDIVFLDDSYELVYPKDSTVSYTKEQLDQMVHIDMVSQKIERLDYVKNGEKFTQIHSNGLTPKTTWYVLMDDQNQYVESHNFYWIKETYSNEDIEYIMNDYIKNAREYVYDFTTYNDDQYYMVVSLDGPIALFETYEIVILICVALSTFALYFFLVKKPVQSLTKTLNQPLSDLSEALQQLTPSSKTYLDKEYGIDEVDQIIETYNNLVSRLDQLEQQNQLLENQKRDMIAAIAHDLKTPMTVIRGYIDLLYQAEKPLEEQKQYMDTIQKRFEYINRLVNELVSYSELEHHGFQMITTTVDANEVLRECIIEQYDEVIKNEFQVSIQILESKTMLQWNVFQMERAFKNILSNFLKYNPKNTLIEISSKEDNNQYQIIFKNNGDPIPETISEHLFEAFVSGDESRGNRSQGLGLSITKRIIELHNGTIEYQSQEPFVNCFIMTFPSNIKKT